MHLIPVRFSEGKTKRDEEEESEKRKMTFPLSDGETQADEEDTEVSFG